MDPCETNDIKKGVVQGATLVSGQSQICGKSGKRTHLDRPYGEGLGCPSE